MVLPPERRPALHAEHLGFPDAGAHDTFGPWIGASLRWSTGDDQNGTARHPKDGRLARESGGLPCCWGQGEALHANVSDGWKETGEEVGVDAVGGSSFSGSMSMAFRVAEPSVPGDV